MPVPLKVYTYSLSFINTAVHHRRRRRKVNLKKERDRNQGNASSHRHGNQSQGSSPSWSGTMHSKYRHLYQIRRVNGDVIAQVRGLPAAIWVLVMLFMISVTCYDKCVLL